MTAQKKGEDIGVYPRPRRRGRGRPCGHGGRSQGDAVLVNIVGDIKPEKVGLIGERLDIEPLRKWGTRSRSNLASALATKRSSNNIPK